MRCPKCHYVSFDGQQRCRNCGYELSLSPAVTASGAEPLDVSTHPGNPQATTFADLSLRPEPQPASSNPDAQVSDVVDRALSRAAGGATNPAGTGRGSAPYASNADFGRANAANASVGDFATGASAVRGSASPSPSSSSSSDGRGTSGTGTGGNLNASAARARRPERQEVDPLDLPLFDPGPAASSPAIDRPLISSASPPRPPLAVRRATPEIPRLRGRVTPPAATPRIEEPTLDLEVPEGLPSPDLASDDTPTGGLRLRGASGTGTGIGANTGAGARGRGLDLDDTNAGAGDTGLRGGRLTPPARVNRPVSGETAREGYARNSRDVTAATESSTDATSTSDAEIDPSIAPLGTRAIAALIDLAFLAIVDFTVMHFTLRLTGVTTGEMARLPLAPLAGFLALLNGGYLTMFTAASGQTMGKMLTGLKVVPASYGTGGVAGALDPPDSPAVPFGHAVLRAILWLLTIVPFGIGALPALLTDDRRALHDRLADTRVIKVE